MHADKEETHVEARNTCVRVYYEAHAVTVCVHANQLGTHAEACMCTLKRAKRQDTWKHVC